MQLWVMRSVSGYMSPPAESMPGSVHSHKIHSLQIQCSPLLSSQRHLKNKTL